MSLSETAARADGGAGAGGALPGCDERFLLAAGGWGGGGPDGTRGDRGGGAQPVVTGPTILPKRNSLCWDEPSHTGSA